MSATGRGAKRRDADYYPTPSATTLAILRAVNLPGGRWLEPSAGSGAIIRAANSVRSDVQWTAIELRDEARPAIEAADASAEIATGVDFLSAGPWPRFNVAILNPPFSDALAFIARCLDLADWIVCLQRINFLGSAGRNSFWRQHMPDVYLLPDRPSFTDGGTDATEYAWFVWPPSGHNRSAGRGEVLPCAPGQATLFDEAREHKGDPAPKCPTASEARQALLFGDAR